VRATLAARDTARHTITVGADHFVYGEVDQVSVDVGVRVLDPEGNAVLRASGLGRGGERFAGELKEAGTYTVELVAEQEDGSGDYALTIHRLEPVAKDPKRLVDQLMARWDGPVPGAAVQVWRGGRTLFSKAYGMANLAYGIPFATSTPTNIGSTSKQFTAFAVLLQAERGLLSLDDDIRKHIPELPAFSDTVRVRHIISHTSGLREFINFLMMGGLQLDKGDWIDRGELIEIVQKQPALQNTPGAEFNYNNTAFGLAAVIVERTSGKPFHEFMRENVFGPLGMTRTMVRPTPRHIVPGSSLGYGPGPDGFLELRDLGASVGAGGIYASVEDLQTWAQNYMKPRVGTPQIVEAMRTSNVLNDGKETGYGYGLFIDEQGGVKRVHHGGADVAHRSQPVFYPELDAGVTVQGNEARFNSNVAFRIAEAFFQEIESEDETTEVAGEFDPASFDPEDFDDFAGRFALDAAPQVVITFSRDGSRYFAEVTGQPRVELTPTSDSTFAIQGVEASVTFHRGGRGPVDALTLHQGGDQRATRLSEDAAEWKPTPEALTEFAGRYFNVELEVFYTLAVEDEKLVLHRRRLEDTTLEPGKQDEFSGGGLQFAFERDRNGQMIGLYVANGRTRDVRFERFR
jgi:CubicO group peptidase (beta-lactamase class C family)